ncbi:ATP-binding protein [Ilumatobacter nonamiensis]|uniref:ATP-binding protein n=1 Tax=Ilumatobacter nonamiensis TaxID=467093 RepID=UPI000591158C|nr:ATP-binding protein [Ilumatobacter nonamiensis]
MDESGDTMSGGHELTVASDPAMIATLRHRVGDLARDSGADDELVADLELAVSELATNVLQHSDSSTIHLVLRREPSQWILDVDHADDLDEIDRTLPDPTALTGRGLFIVQSVMDDVEIVNDAGHRRVRCAKRVS